MRITKTDFTRYLKCPESFWIAKRDPAKLEAANRNSAFSEKLMREGYEVEELVQDLFRRLGKPEVELQVVFESCDGLFARADVVERSANNGIAIYEVKSSTSIKTGPEQNHLNDICFQKICAERSGQKVDNVFIIHLNGNYVRRGEIEPTSLFEIVDVTEKVNFLAPEIAGHINDAINFLSETGEFNGCSCLEKTRGQHCDTFELLNPGLPEPSIYELPRLRASKIKDLVSRGILGVKEIPEDYPLSETQIITVEAAKSMEPQVNVSAIHTFLAQLKFPLHFFDYETFASAVPIIDGISPHQNFPVQYSLHILHRNGSLEHREYLQREPKLPTELIDSMAKDIAPNGSLISWHASFEKTQNSRMAADFPDKADFLTELNQRMVDLEDVFKTDYVDIRFGGSTSIKRVLPVICPKLAYGDLAVQNGAAAVDAWQKMIEADQEEANIIAQSLLDYCKLDTYAMVEIYRYLEQI